MLTNCKIFVAKTAGFCFGVDRAIKIVYNKLDNQNKKVVTLGPIIHNQSVVDDLRQKGVEAVDKISDAAGCVTIIRSHGVAKDVYDELLSIGAEIIDATCPFVSRIHDICFECSSDGYTMLIAGNKTHPEVVGIEGHCQNGAYVFSTERELTDILSKLEPDEKIAVVSQTTFNESEWKKLKSIILSSFPNAKIYDTICSATSKRQSNARELSKKADVMLIVGGRNSSNTLKLKEVCSENCKTFLVEDAKELYDLDFSDVKFLGISAGASTPAYIIKEVERTVTEILNNEENFDFEEAIDKSFKKIYIGAKLTGKVTAVNKSEALVDIGVKSTGVIPSYEISNDTTKKPEELLAVGDVIDVVVMRTNDSEGIVTLSKKRVDALVGFETVKKAKEEDTVLTGTVTDVVKGGMLVSTNGIKVFIPGTQSNLRKGENLDQLLKQEVSFKIIDVDEKRNRAVGSIRAVVREQREKAKAAFLESAEAGQVVTGTVKSIMDYGVFVDLGGIDGLVRKPDLTWKRIKHPSDVVAVGDEVEVKIKEIDKETGKIALIMKKEEDNPWVIFNKNYGVGQEITVTIVSITSFGAFARIIDGIDGLIHISQIANKRVENVADVLKVGDEVQVKITDINTERSRISLSMRALLPVEEERPKEEPAEEPESDVVSSTEDDHSEDEAPVEEVAEAVEEAPVQDAVEAAAAEALKALADDKDAE
ncbi:MAG: bifunctional 4-hydroxy-3-methylbut-2-enyl diphosphate reductase/30S ribosomal protein S1 [Ruminococcus sp.]|nr:bifunctional 4-hydroxy-3-methylbut-2-enyl diphosphate reductase/30S ribosomal protein S1 [Ruminococcus sp.]